MEDIIVPAQPLLQVLESVVKLWGSVSVDGGDSVAVEGVESEVLGGD